MSATPGTPVLWSRRTWEEIPGDLAAASATAILPIGATEQHGPHLGCGMDFVLAERLAHDVSALTGVPVLPTLAYGCSLGHSRRWPGTIAIDPLVLTQLVTQIGKWAYASGVRRLITLNAHVTNAAPLRCALELLRAEHDDLMIANVDTAKISPRIREAHFADAEDWHANAAETELMMATAPDMVRLEKCADADDPDRTEGHIFSHPVNRTSRNGVTGYPSRASRDDGETLYAWMVDDFADLVRRAQRETPPLSHGYNTRIGAENV